MLITPQSGTAWPGALGALLAAVSLLLLPQVVVAAPPPNDNLADAAELSGLPVEWTGSNVDATREPGEPNHFGGGAGDTPSGDSSIWFRWTAPRDAGVTLVSHGCAPPFQTPAGPTLGIAVYTRSDVFGLVRFRGSLQPFRVAAGQAYWIAVDSPAGQEAPSGVAPQPSNVCLRLLPAPSNDDFAQAALLTGFPVGVTVSLPRSGATTEEGGATVEPGEPHHGGERPGYSVWYRWTAPVDGPVILRLCGTGVLALYRGERIDALTHVATRRTREGKCGTEAGASVVVDASTGEAFRIAFSSSTTSSSPLAFQLMVGNQLAVVTRAGGAPLFSYTAFPGEADHVELRLAGVRRERALLVNARGVRVANGCRPEPAPGLLRCPIPGRAAPVLDIALGDGRDTADISMLGPVAASFDEPHSGRVLGGDGNDTLRGSAGSHSWVSGWSGGVRLLGGPGADRLLGRRGFDRLDGGAGADNIAGGPGDDTIHGGPGRDRIYPGAASDGVDSGPGNDRVRTVDGSSDDVRCRKGRDRAQIDGFDLPADCERRTLSAPARAVAVWAAVSNDDGEGADHLELGIACPIDAKKGCRATVRAIIPGEGTISRRRMLGPGRSDVMRIATRTYAALDRMVRRGVRVTVDTRRGGLEMLRFTQRLPAPDNRYTGEG